MENKNLQTYSLDLDNQEKQAVLINTLAKGASKAEFLMFIEICKASGLNPFQKEIWFIKTNQGVQIMTGINGFYTIANSYAEFDGIETEIVEENGKIIKAITKVFRKDRSRPTVAECYFSEYNKGFGNWKTMPRMMITKCAEATAIRKAFPQKANGLYTEEEYIGANSIPTQLKESKSSPINSLLEKTSDPVVVPVEEFQEVIEDFSEYANDSFLTGEE
jgi:phage recombination protein Bet